MKCHYEVLSVPRDVNNEDLKKAYRRAALKWHPDKNLDNPDLAKEQFQFVQQAYEVLSDPHERAWFDNHRDAILKGGLGGDYKDDSLDVFPYFSTSCFKGFGDDDSGFYSVYREVFNKIAAEDSEYMDDGDSDFEIPEFGTSTSDFKDVVQSFYAYWQDYTTRKSFSWLDQCDIRDLPNRRIAKLVERENKKIRDKARKERNEQIRNLVAFVRKRDKRVQAQAAIVKVEQAAKARLAEEKRKSKVRERQQQMQGYQETEWSKFSNIENELKSIEKSLQAEYGDHDSSEDESEVEDDENEEDIEDYGSLYCPACQKLFKTDKAFSNHEKSKKHKENVEVLRQTLLEEDGEMGGELEEEESCEEEEEGEDDSEDVCSDKEELNGDNKTEDSNEEEVKLEIGSENSDSAAVPSKSKTKKKKKQNMSAHKSSSEDEDSEVEEVLSKKQRRKLQQQRVPGVKGDSEVETEVKSTVDANTDADANDDADADADEDAEPTSVKQDNVPKTKLKGKKAKDARKLKKQGEATSSTNGTEDLTKLPSGKVHSKKASRRNNPVDTSVIDIEHACVTCSSNFGSKNKLFEHLKKTGHSVFIPDKNGSVDAIDEKKKGKGRRK